MLIIAATTALAQSHRVELVVTDSTVPGGQQVLEALGGDLSTSRSFSLFGAGRPNYGALQVRRQVDGASSMLQQFFSQREELDQVELRVYGAHPTTGALSQLQQSILWSNAYVDAMAIDLATVDAGPREQLGVEGSCVVVASHFYSDQGVLIGSNVSGYDRAVNLVVTGCP